MDCNLLVVNAMGLRVVSQMLVTRRLGSDSAGDSIDPVLRPDALLLQTEGELILACPPWYRRGWGSSSAPGRASASSLHLSGCFAPNNRMNPAADSILEPPSVRAPNIVSVESKLVGT